MKRPGRKLTSEEMALWTKVALTVTPLERRMSRPVEERDGPEPGVQGPRRVRPTQRPAPVPVVEDRHASLVEQLAQLGATGTSHELHEALRVCFPDGTDGCDEAHVVKVLLRYFRRSKAAK